MTLQFLTVMPQRLATGCNASSTIRYGCLNQFVFFEERHLRYVVKELMAHYHAERFHQGLGGQLNQKPAGSAKENGAHGKVVCRSRLGGLLNLYVREAA